MDKNTRFDVPTQVLFVDSDGVWCAGIAYEDYIICGCCGGIFYIEDIFDEAPEYVQCAIHKYENWVDLSDEIRGGETPESFIMEPAAPVVAEEEAISVEC